FFFRAIASDGQPVVDLKAADLTLKIGGAPRTVRGIALLQSAAGHDRAAAPASGAPRPPFATNQGLTGGRDVLPVLDDRSVAPGGIDPVRERLAGAVSALAAGDRVGLLSVRPGGVNIGLTTQHTAVQAAIAALAGQRGSGDPCRAPAIVETLKNLIEGTR